MIRWRPAEPRWFFGFSLALAGMALLYADYQLRFPFNPGAGYGLAFGIASAVLMTLALLLNLRKKLMFLPVGRTHYWYQLHIYGGTLSFVLMVMHSGGRVSGGIISWALMGLFLLVALTGFIGLFLQKYVPPALTSNLQVEATFERVPALVSSIREEAEEFVKEASGIVRSFYEAEIAPDLAAPSPRISHLWNSAGDMPHKMALFDHTRLFLEPSEQVLLEDLREIYREKKEIDVQYSLQRILRYWLLVHVPCSYALWVVVAIHVVSFFYY